MTDEMTTALPFRLTVAFRAWWAERFEATDFDWLASEFGRSAVPVDRPPFRVESGKAVYHTPEFPEVYLITAKDAGWRAVIAAKWHEPEPPAPAVLPASLGLPESVAPPPGMSAADLCVWAKNALTDVQAARVRLRASDRAAYAAANPLLVARETELIRLARTAGRQSVKEAAERRRDREAEWDLERGRVVGHLRATAAVATDPTEQAALYRAADRINANLHRPEKHRGGAA
jgi:hypothetical protein